IVGETVGFFMSALKAVANLTKIKRLQAALDNLQKMQEAQEIADSILQVLDAMGPLKGLMTTLATQISQELIYGNVDNVKATADLISETSKAAYEAGLLVLQAMKDNPKLWAKAARI